MHCWLEVVSGCGDEVVSEANRTSADMEFVGFRSWIELRGIVDNLATGADRKSEEEGSEAKDEEEFLEAWKIVRSCNVIRNTPYTLHSLEIVIGSIIVKSINTIFWF